MSSTEQNNLNHYKATLSCFENLETTCHQQNKCYEAVVEQMRTCIVQINCILASENDELLSEGLLQLKKQISLTIENILKKRFLPRNSINLTKDVTISKIISGKRQMETTDKGVDKRKRLDEMAEKKMLHIIRGLEEIPTVQSLSQIAGLYEVKKILKSIIILPQTQPQLFAGKLYYNTILLYGPPGTGKTHMVHALASEAKAKLYTMSGSNVLSAYVGQTEETIQSVFKYIKSSNQTSILFIDEIDGLCRKRSSNEQDYSRRIKTELMCQLSRIEDCMHVYVICATNCPWDLDTAILRRFQRHVYIPLPNRGERLEFFRIFVEGHQFEERIDLWSTIADQTEGYSGSDLACVMKHALNSPITELEDTKIWKFCADGYYEPIVDENDIDNIICCDLDQLPPHSVRTRQLDISDILYATDHISATVSQADVLKYQIFNNRFNTS